MSIIPSDSSQPAGESQSPSPRLVVRRPRTSGTYVLACLGFTAALLIIGLLSKEIPFGRVVFVSLIFYMCAGPFLMGRGNPRHRLVSMFMGSYFLLFGTGTLFRMVDGAANRILAGGATTILPDSNTLTTSDFVVLLGLLCFLVAYIATIRARGHRRSRFLVYEWRYSTVLTMGFVLWVIGFAFMVAYDLTASVHYLPEYVLGVPLSLASNLKLLSPIGAVMLIYLLTRQYRTRLIGAILVVIIGCEFALGFIASSKEMSFRIAVLVLLGLYYVRGRVNLKIIAVMLLVSIPYLLYFNAYREQMMVGGFKNAADAFAHFNSNLAVVKSKTKAEKDVAGSSLKSLSDRVDNKVYVDIIVQGTDSGKVPRLNGESLGYFFTSFVPRAIWPDKPVTTTGQMFNHAFGLSASRLTYVPTTQLGDLYWNFGMPAVIIGMLIIGYIFARMACAFLDDSGMTLPRFVCLMMATYYLAVFFSGNIASQYSIFVRLLFGIWLLDRFLRYTGISRPVGRPGHTSRKPAQRPAPATGPDGRPAPGPAGPMPAAAAGR